MVLPGAVLNDTSRCFNHKLIVGFSTVRLIQHSFINLTTGHENMDLTTKYSECLNQTAQMRSLI